MDQELKTNRSEANAESWHLSHDSCIGGRERVHRALLTVSDVALSNRGHLSVSRGGRRGLSGLLGGLGGSGGSLGGGGSGALSGGLGGGIILLAGGVNRDLNGDLTALNLLAVHLSASLLLELLGAEGNETEATALARLTASLELLNHEAGDGAEGDLGLGGGVILEDLEELQRVSTTVFDISLEQNVRGPP